jgi:PAS domain S-box-containing protein
MSISGNTKISQEAAYEVHQWWFKKVVETGTIHQIDDMSKFKESDLLKNIYERMGVKSIVGIPISYGAYKWGGLYLSEYESYRFWTEEEIELLRTIANQVYIAIKQAELYSTAKQQAERERVLNNQLKAILDNLPFRAWLKDNENRFIAVNKPFATECNQTPQELIGKTDFDIFPERLSESHLEDDIEIMKTGVQKSIEELIVTPEGTKWFETFKTPIFDENNKVIGTTGFSRDISERKKIEQMKDEFVSMVSHELRTPLTSIQGSLGLVLSKVLGEIPPRVQELLEIANNNTIRLKDLINDILDIQKIHEEKIKFKMEQFNLTNLIKESIALNEAYGEKYKINFVFESSFPELLIKSDRSRLIQVMTNFLSNASKFSNEGNDVLINTEILNENVRVSVTNKGQGIPDEFKSRIFEKFFQVDSASTRKFGGTGLGLSICKLIIEKLGGKINFTSNQGISTTFYFDLPIV